MTIWPHLTLIRDAMCNSIMVQMQVESLCQDHRSMDALELLWQKFVQRGHISTFSTKMKIFQFDIHTSKVQFH